MIAKCEDFLSANGFPPGQIRAQDFVRDEHAQAHEVAYLKLRDFLREHIALGNQPALHETVAPYGGRAWQSDRRGEVAAAYNAQRIHPHGPAQAEEADYENEEWGADPDLEEDDLNEFQGPTILE